MAFTKITAAGIGSTETVTIDGLSVINNGSFGGNVSVGGTLTYEDVTNIDSVGLITARAGVVVGSGITLSKDGDIFATGVTTSTTFSGAFSGSGANITALNASNISSGTVPTARLGSGTASSSTFLAGDSTFKTVTGTTINNNADNRLITGSGSANTLEGESTLTYDSGGLNIAGDSSRDGLKITNTGDHLGEICVTANRSSANSAIMVLRGEWNNTEVASIYISAGSDTTNKDDGQIKFYTSPDSGTGIQNRMTIDQNGIVTKPNHPYFRADLATSQQNVNLPDAAVKFSSSSGLNGHYFTDVKYNNGSHYNSSNSRFTAPVDGLYQFIQEIGIHGSGTTIAYLGCELYINDNRWNAGWSNQAAGYQVERRVWMIELNANDYVEPGYELSSSGSTPLIADGNLRRPYNTFQGFLIA